MAHIISPPPPSDPVQPKTDEPSSVPEVDRTAGLDPTAPRFATANDFSTPIQGGNNYAVPGVGSVPGGRVLAEDTSVSTDNPFDPRRQVCDESGGCRTEFTVPLFFGNLSPSGSPGSALGTLRGDYLRGVSDIAGKAQAMRSAGSSVETAARWAVGARNMLKLEVRSQGSWFAARLADLRNLILYGNRAGPTAEQLFGELKSWESVLESVTRTSDTVNKLSGQ